MGTYSVRTQFAAQNGQPILRFDNNTAYVADIDISDVGHFNFSIRTGTAGSGNLYAITFHNTVAKFYSVIPNVALTTTWTVYDYTRNEMTSIGGMTAADHINWIDFYFSSPINNRWVYVDAPMFYNTPTQTRLSASFNFTNIAAFEHYALNVSAASNVSAENMRISHVLEDDSVFDIEGGGAWENFTIILNTTRIQEQTFKNIWINSTLLDDTNNSTLDIDLFIITAWNESNSYPVILGTPQITNLDDTDTMYAYYRVYTATANVSDADGVSDLDWIQFGIEDTASRYAFKAGYHQSASTWEVISGSTNISIVTASCSVVAGTVMTTSELFTFAFYTTTNLPSRANWLLCIWANDTANATDEVEVDSIVTERNVDLSDVYIVPDEGPTGTYTMISGYLTYYDSALIPPTAYYDIWLISQNSTLQTEIDEWDTDDGYFEGVIAAEGEIGTEAFLLSVQTEDDIGRGGTTFAHAEEDYVYFTVMSGHGDDDDSDEFWGGFGDLFGDVPWWVIIIIFIIMVIIMGGCCPWLPEACDGCRGCGEGGCRPRAPDVELPKLTRKKRPSTGKYNKGRRILGGMQLNKPFKLIRRGMPSGKKYVGLVKAIAKALRFKR